MVYFFLAFELNNLTATDESLVDCLKRRDGLFGGVSRHRLWKEARKRPCGRVSLCGLCQWEENVRVDKLACVGGGRS